MSEHGGAYKAFWEALLPQSNRRTGFSIRHAAKRHFVSFQLVGFQFTWARAYPVPDDRYPAPALLTGVSCPGLSQPPREQ
jgi:hypothetical protein